MNIDDYRNQFKGRDPRDILAFINSAAGRYEDNHDLAGVDFIVKKVWTEDDPESDKMIYFKVQYQAIIRSPGGGLINELVEFTNYRAKSFSCQNRRQEKLGDVQERRGPHCELDQVFICIQTCNKDDCDFGTNTKKLLREEGLVRYSEIWDD